MYWTRVVLLSAALISIQFFRTEAEIFGRFVQIGDFHYDPTYETFGNSCNTEIPEEQRKPYGNYNCDAPLKLVENAIHEANILSNYQTDFVMWAGDFALHVREKNVLNVDQVLDILNASSILIRGGIHQDTPIFPMLGNHDYLPKSQLPTTGGLYQRIGDIFCPIFELEGNGCDDFVQAGYYSRLIDDKLLLLITNSNLYDRSNNETLATDPDPAGQFAWMRSRLEDARNRGYRVHVFAHIPPGFFEGAKNVMWFKDQHNQIFNEIIRDYSDIIIGVYSAHAHTDSFRIYYNEEKKPVVPLLISPAVTPWRWPGGDGKTPPRNPALRVITHQITGDMELINYDQYYLNLERANDPTNTVIRWDKEYGFTSYEGAANASAASMHEVVENFKSYASTGFHKYFERTNVLIMNNHDKPSGLRYTCDMACKEQHICAIKNLDKEEYRKCLDTMNLSSSSSILTAGYRQILTSFMSLVALVLATKIHI